MFANFEVIDDQRHIITVTLNVTHITSFELIIPRNPDSGCFLNMRDGRQWETVMGREDLLKKCNGIMDRFGNQILVSYLAENVIKPAKSPIKKAVKKRGQKTVKY